MESERTERVVDELAMLLDRERVLLELLVFKVVELRQLMLAGEARFLGWAAEEVERAAEGLREAELRRALLVDAIAEDYGVGGAPLPLSAVAELAPDEYRPIFADHRAALLRLTDELEEQVAAGRLLAEAGHAAIGETLDRLAGLEAARVPAAATYGPQARWDLGAPLPRVQRTM